MPFSKGRWYSPDEWATMNAPHQSEYDATTPWGLGGAGTQSYQYNPWDTRWPSGGMATYEDTLRAMSGRGGAWPAYQQGMGGGYGQYWGQQQAGGQGNVGNLLRSPGMTHPLPPQLLGDPWRHNELTPVPWGEQGPINPFDPALWRGDAGMPPMGGPAQVPQDMYNYGNDPVAMANWQGNQNTIGLLKALLGGGF